VSIAVWCSPGATRSALGGVTDGRLRLRLAARAHEGRANAELVRLLAETLGVRPGAVAISAGESGRRKVVRVRGITIDEAQRRLRLEEE
jgi:uncharacterized protein (TIGR00251 family)